MYSCTCTVSSSRCASPRIGAAMGEKLGEERTKAVRMAVADIIAAHAKENGRPPTKTQLGEWFGVTQQKMSSFEKDGVVGTKLADGVAEHLGTTVDGLVQRY